MIPGLIGYYYFVHKSLSRYPACLISTLIEAASTPDFSIKAHHLQGCPSSVFIHQSLGRSWGLVISLEKMSSF